MDNWDEVRTAFHVARLGTVSGAADVLGVHHATVIRHIDSLEGRLGVRLFQRHARGYTATEAGQDLMRVAQATDDQFNQLEGRIKGRGNEVSGELVITSLASLVHLMTPVLAAFQKEFPDVVVRYLTGDRLFRLEYGEAHVAIRAGTAPEQPDNVVQPFLTLRVGLFASKDYISRHGMPSGPEEFDQHFFVGTDETRSRAPFNAWMSQHVPRERVIFRASDPEAWTQATREGIGLGFMSYWEATDDPNLIEVMPPLDEWRGALWLVTHVDLHRTTKVQAFLKFLKVHSVNWNIE